MRKPSLLFRGPVQTRSGYGSHSRDLLEALYKMDLFDIKIDSCNWGLTPMNALENDNLFHNWIKSNIINSLQEQPDIYIQVTVPNEFQPIGKINIGITAGIESTLAPKDWIDGCNRMNLIITTSQFSKDVLLATSYNEFDIGTNKLLNTFRVNKSIEVLFEGIDTKIYNNQYQNFPLDIKEDFCFLFVGQWLKGNIGEDRKDVGMLIKTFIEAFKYEKVKPALILKTSSATFSILQREELRNRIEQIVGNEKNPPSIYLLFGDLTNDEMNNLYNHEKIKTMISLTKGEGFGRPLLEFTMSGKPIITTNWSGHKDFLPIEKTVLLSGELQNIHESAADQFLLKEAQWFKVNYNEAIGAMKIIYNGYNKYKNKAELLRKENVEKFSLEKMKERFEEILKPFIANPTEKKLVLPKLNKI